MTLRVNNCITVMTQATSFLVKIYLTYVGQCADDTLRLSPVKPVMKLKAFCVLFTLSDFSHCSRE